MSSLNSLNDFCVYPHSFVTIAFCFLLAPQILIFLDSDFLMNSKEIL